MSISKLKSLFRDRRGLSTVEYTVLLVLIVCGSLAAWRTVGHEIYSKVNKGGEDLQKVTVESVQQ